MLNSGSTDLDHRIEKRGGIFDVQMTVGPIKELFVQLNGKANQYSADVRIHAYTRSRRPIRFAFLTATAIDAFAYASGDPGGFDFIGMNAGFVATFLGLFNRLLAHPLNFPHIGDPSLEVAAAPIAYLTTDIVRDPDVCFARCPVRQNYAWTLTHLAFDYFYFHELTHLRHGHLEYLQNHDMGKVLEERNARNAESLRLAWQTLEWDADSGAVKLTLELAHNIARISRTNPESVECNAARARAVRALRKATALAGDR
jgi:hypothetical protein